MRAGVVVLVWVAVLCGCATTTRVRLLPAPSVRPGLLEPEVSARPFWPLTRTTPARGPGAPERFVSSPHPITSAEELVARGRCADALTLYLSVADTDPDRDYALYRAAWCELALDRWQAIERLWQARDRTGSPFLRAAIDAEMPHFLARFLDADHAIAQVRKTYVDARAVFDQLAAEYATLGRHRDALAVLLVLPHGVDRESCERRVTELRLVVPRADARQLRRLLDVLPDFSAAAGISDCDRAIAEVFLDRWSRGLAADPALGPALARRFPQDLSPRILVAAALARWPDDARAAASLDRWIIVGDLLVDAARRELSHYGELANVAVRGALAAWENALTVARAEGTLDFGLVRHARISAMWLTRMIPPGDPTYARARAMFALREPWHIRDRVVYDRRDGRRDDAESYRPSKVPPATRSNSSRERPYPSR